ncbi:alpha/beta hydrolase [Pelagibacterium sp. H642]|uniref:alpha/beta hydrolase n=1 Tax=Pelagibacterium sp. H642 TaxID=1881069 RepID=UPI0028161C20|nr:alpha/beta hydrolase [Pelagibacterium sp. H642]WMT92679.1 alpha/beta hydrolase [Pelagibacterium sp. H642]
MMLARLDIHAQRGEPNMSRQILFVQGAGECVHDAWDNKLVRSLEARLGPQYDVRYPRMPNEAEPLYPSWKAALFKQFDELDDNAILIGHSIGGTFLIHAVAEYRPKQKWSAVFLIAAPFLGEGGWPADETDPTTHLADELRADVPVLLYHGTADEEVPPRHMELYTRAITHASARLLADRDHQLNNDLSHIAQDIRHGRQSPE